MIEKIQTMQTEPLEIIYPAGKSIALLPVPRSRLLELRGLFVELQSIWLSHGFGTGETVADDRAWEIMGEIAAFLPHQDNAAIAGFDLEALSNDYKLLEGLFFSTYLETSPEDLHGWQIVNLDLEKFQGCKILALHRMNPKSVLLEADDRRRETKDDSVTDTVLRVA